MRFHSLTGPQASSSCRTTESCRDGAIFPTYTVVDLGAAPADGTLRCCWWCCGRGAA